MLGGKDGVCGKHTVTRADGAHALPAKTTLALHEGERIAVQTPGGGGYGPPSERAAEARAADRRSGL
jgi:N-methylhydantoinase B